jgi:RNA polymerase sigma-70 factor (ECF subfamily)
MSSTSAARLVTRNDADGYNTAAMTDAALVRGVLAGNPAAFGALMDRHAGACLRYALRILGNRQDAEDVTQETFVRAYRAIGRYDGSVAFQTWLMTILINRCRTALGSRRRRESRIVSDGEAVTAAISPSRDPYDGLDEAISKAVGQLHPKQREAFLLKHVEEMSYEEMSAITGVGISALKMRVQRAREELQDLLEESRND